MTTRKKVVVTGASSGIGEATALRFAQEGWDVCVTARREKELRDLVKKFPEGDHMVCPGDYSNLETANMIDRMIREKWGRVDALANVAGIFWEVNAIETPLEEWRKQFDIMVNGAVYMTRMVVPWMKEGGRIIHCTSVHGERAYAGASSYSMAKAAINQYCRSLACELGSKNILVNAIAPGFVRTPMSVVNGENELDGEWFKQNYVVGNHLALRRGGMPEELAGVFFFLAGPDATYITGQVITVDGGLIINF
ncbi:MAG: SDR family oxidoreductase [Anaerolineales bacterium]|jgi:3-oxoacyl-[acyl-carrier protein] reductase